MADLVIRGLGIPKERSLLLCIKTDGTVYNIKPGGIGTAHAVGTAVHLPEGHGRLGDLDALINELQNLFDKREKDAIFSGDRTVGVTWDDAIHHIIAAPTIVPAEGGADDGT